MAVSPPTSCGRRERGNMTAREIRELTGLSRAKFSKKYNIPSKTIEHWESNSPKYKRSCPPYVLELLERAVREDFQIPEEKEE
jgi:transcriptional regulator with XRE-family HTH domain